MPGSVGLAPPRDEVAAVERLVDAQFSSKTYNLLLHLLHSLQPNNNDTSKLS